MPHATRSLRPFIGARDYDRSRAFYTELGFVEHVIDPSMSLFAIRDGLAFYLQRYYDKRWVENTMLFLEVDDLEAWQADLHERALTTRFPEVKLSAIKTWDWGRELFMHDPAGVLWHIGSFAG